RDISTLVAGNDTGLSPRFVVVPRARVGRVDYEPSVGALRNMIVAHSAQEVSDPVRVAQVVLRMAAHDNPPTHLLLGTDSLRYFGMVDGARIRAAEAWRA